MSVACRDEQGLAVVVLGHGVEVDVVEGVVLRALTVLELRLGLVDGDGIEGVPLEQRITGCDVDLLDDSLPGPTVLVSADGAQIRLRLDIGDEEHGVIGGDGRLVQVGGVLGELSAHADTGDLPIRGVDDDDLTGGVRRLGQPLPPGEHRLPLIFLDAQIPQCLGLVPDPHRVTGGVEDEAAHPGLVVGLRLSLRSEERLQLSVVVGEGPGIDVDLRRGEFGAGAEVPAFGDGDVVIGIGRAPCEQESRCGQS